MYVIHLWQIYNSLFKLSHFALPYVHSHIHIACFRCTTPPTSLLLNMVSECMVVLSNSLNCVVITPTTPTINKTGSSNKEVINIMNTKIGSALPTEKLDRTNFASWDYKMHQYLVGQGYCSYIQEAHGMQPNPTHANYPACELSRTSIIERSEDKTRKQERGKRIRTQLIESVTSVVHLD